MHYTYYDSPVGKLLLAGDDAGLRILSFPEGHKKRVHSDDWAESTALFAAAIEQLRAYFDGELTVFSLDLAPVGTAFQCAVWQALQTIPYGETRSYGEIARQIDKPKAVRAVGAANGSNPLPIIVPCHRVIGHNGRLTGFGGGLPTKHFLLNLEGARQGVLAL